MMVQEPVDDLFTPWDMAYISWLTSVDPDLNAHFCSLICIYTICFLVKETLMMNKVTSVDPDQAAQMFTLIRICTLCIWDKSHIHGVKK